jgi:hypothetical protein
VSGQLHAPGALPRWKQPPAPIGYEAGGAPEPVWMMWSKEKSLVPAVNRTPAVQPVAIPTLRINKYRVVLKTGPVVN